MNEKKVETINLISDPKTSWYFRWLLAVTNFPEKFPNSKIAKNKPISLKAAGYVRQESIVVAADMMGTFPPSRNGFKYVLVQQDLITKWVDCIPLRSATGKRLRHSFYELIINRWGIPQVLLTDNGTEFTYNTLRSLAQSFNIFHVTTPPYHPQAKPVESVNWVFKTMMVSFINKDYSLWDQHLSELRFAYNTAYHSYFKGTHALLISGVNRSRKLTK